MAEYQIVGHIAQEGRRALRQRTQLVQVDGRTAEGDAAQPLQRVDTLVAAGWEGRAEDGCVHVAWPQLQLARDAGLGHGDRAKVIWPTDARAAHSDGCRLSVLAVAVELRLLAHVPPRLVSLPSRDGTRELSLSLEQRAGDRLDKVRRVDPSVINDDQDGVTRAFGRQCTEILFDGPEVTARLQQAEPLAAHGAQPRWDACGLLCPCAVDGRRHIHEIWHARLS